MNVIRTVYGTNMIVNNRAATQPPTGIDERRNNTPVKIFRPEKEALKGVPSISSLVLE